MYYRVVRDGQLSTNLASSAIESVSGVTEIRYSIAQFRRGTDGKAGAVARPLIVGKERANYDDVIAARIEQLDPIPGHVQRRFRRRYPR